MQGIRDWLNGEFDIKGFYRDYPGASMFYTICGLLILLYAIKSITPDNPHQQAAVVETRSADTRSECDKCLAEIQGLTYALCVKNAHWNGESGWGCGSEAIKAARIAYARHTCRACPPPD